MDSTLARSRETSASSHPPMDPTGPEPLPVKKRGLLREPGSAVTTAPPRPTHETLCPTESRPRPFPPQLSAPAPRASPSGCAGVLGPPTVDRSSPLRSAAGAGPPPGELKFLPIYTLTGLWVRGQQLAWESPQLARSHTGTHGLFWKVRTQPSCPGSLLGTQ